MHFTRKLGTRAWLRVSVLLNVILACTILFIAVISFTNNRTDASFYADLNDHQRYYCQDRYDKAMQDIAAQNLSPDETSARKNTYAMTVCLKNYKTGKELDLTPLVEQVNRTQPVTNVQVP